jgi:hypothetical protein
MRVVLSSEQQQGGDAGKRMLPLLPETLIGSFSVLVDVAMQKLMQDAAVKAKAPTMKLNLPMQQFSVPECK